MNINSLIKQLNTKTSGNVSTKKNDQWLPLKLKIAICSGYMTQNKNWRKKSHNTRPKQMRCSHGWVCEVLREEIKGCTQGWGGRRGGAQLEDLLIALADRRSFPETRFFVARGIVGETWSVVSVAPAAFPASVLVLPVKEPVPLIG